jgi:hypothetical protein
MARHITPTSGQLARVGVTIVRQEPLTLQCQHCNAEWIVQHLPNGHLPRYYWRCQNGCNWQPR